MHVELFYIPNSIRTAEQKLLTPLYTGRLSSTGDCIISGSRKFFLKFPTCKGGCSVVTSFTTSSGMLITCRFKPTIMVDLYTGMVSSVKFDMPEKAYNYVSYHIRHADDAKLSQMRKNTSIDKQTYDADMKLLASLA